MKIFARIIFKGILKSLPKCKAQFQILKSFISKFLGLGNTFYYWKLPMLYLICLARGRSRILCEGISEFLGNHVMGLSYLVDLWVKIIKIKKPMNLCTRSTLRSSEQSTKHRSHRESMQKVCLFSSQNNKIVWLSNSGLFFLDCALWMLTVWAGKLWLHGSLRTIECEKRGLIEPPVSATVYSDIREREGEGEGDFQKKSWQH